MAPTKILDTEALVAELRRVHGAHTIILYGSQARGDATAESDIDVAAFADIPTTRRDARRWEGHLLDAFACPTTVLTHPPDVDALKLLGGRVLLDERGLAEPLLAALQALHAAGAPALTADDAQMRRVWAHKSLARAGRGDIEADYRRHWLLFQLLEDHYALEGRWYPGPKVAFRDLERRAPADLRLFRDALAPGASLATLAALVARIAGPPPP